MWEQGGGKGGFPDKPASKAQCEVTVKLNIISVVQSVSEDKLSTILHGQNKISPTHSQHAQCVFWSYTRVGVDGRVCSCLMLIGYQQLMDHGPPGCSDPD